LNPSLNELELKEIQFYVKFPCLSYHCNMYYMEEKTRSHLVIFIIGIRMSIEVREMA